MDDQEEATLFIHTIEKELKNFIETIDSLAESLPITMHSIEETRSSIGSDLAKTLVSFVKQYPSSVKREDILNLTNIISSADENENIPNKKIKIKIDTRSQSGTKFLKLAARSAKLSLASNLIQRSFIISLVSQFDAFLGGIIRIMFLAQPDSLNVSEKNLTFSQLQTFESIQEAREYIIEKEIESVLRKSHSEQFDWLEGKYGLELRKGLSIWPTFIEITERRNLFVHSNGIVSNQYINICNKHKVNLIEFIQVGTMLEVTPDYFETAYECIFEIGVKLAHTLWRKILPKERNEADLSLTDISYNLLIDEKYNLVQILLDFALETFKKFASEERKRTFIINRALGYKWAGNSEKANNIIKNEDWSAVNNVYKLAETVILDEFDKANDLITKIGTNGDIGEMEYREWPLFKEYRKSEAFLKTFEEVFKKPYDPEKPQLVNVNLADLEKIFDADTSNDLPHETTSLENLSEEDKINYDG